MRQFHFSRRQLDRLLPIAAGILPAAICSSAYALPALALTADNRLITFDTANPAVFSSNVAVTGLANGEDLLGIDLRPATGQIFGLGNSGQVYVVNFVTGAATAVGAPLDPTAVPLAGQSYGFDFNPDVDRIRVTSDLGENFRLNPNNGALVLNDGSLAFAAGDVNAASPPTITASAYNNNNVANTPATTLYNIDSALGVLTIQNPPNDGTQSTVGPLGTGADGPLYAGFDISSLSNQQAFALTTFEPAFGSFPALNARLYQINLGTGAATSVGLFGTGTTVVTDLTVLPEPTSIALFVAGIGAVALRRRRQA